VTADTPDIQTIAEPIVDEARSTFSLTDALHGVKRKTTKLLVFTDEEAVIAYAELQNQQTIAGVRAGSEDLTDEDRARYRAEIDELEPQVEEAKTAMLASALSLHLRSVPDVVMDAGRRKARKSYAVDGVIPDDKLEDANAIQQNYVLGRVIAKVVNSAGAEATFDRDTIAEDLRSSLPLPQWTRLVRTYNEIVFTDTLGAQATLDPGF
jgi:hypothetical protein